jgi:hypothetical protein
MGRVVKATPTQSKPLPKPVTTPPTEDKVPGPVKGAAKKFAPKAGTPKRAPTNGAKHKADTSKCPAEAPKHKPSQSPIEEIADLLDNLHLDACMELTRRLLTALPNLPPGAARSRAVLKTVVLFISEYGSTA